MSSLKKIIFLLLPILSFSCQTRLERQGWQRTAVVSQLDTSIINKMDKELIVVNVQDNKSHRWFNFFVKYSSFYGFNFFAKDSAGKIVNKPFPIVMERSFKSDIAYYKWESDSVCLIKLLNHGNVQASLELTKSSDSSASLKILNEPKPSTLTQ